MSKNIDAKTVRLSLSYIKNYLLDIVEEIDNLPRSNSLDSSRHILQSVSEIESAISDLEYHLEGIHEFYRLADDK